MTSRPADPPERSAADAAAPLRFQTHNFEAFCFNTLACSVIYNERQFTQRRLDTPAPPPPQGDYRKRWGPASYIVLKPGFPGPVHVRWTALDGSEHQAEVDLDGIFAERAILHRVPAADLPEDVYVASPSIYLEVDDRSVNVYMRAMVPTRTAQIPGNPHSDFRDDVILAWSRTY